MVSFAFLSSPLIKGMRTFLLRSSHTAAWEKWSHLMVRGKRGISTCKKFAWVVFISVLVNRSNFACPPACLVGRQENKHDQGKEGEWGDPGIHT